MIKSFYTFAALRSVTSYWTGISKMVLTRQESIDALAHVRDVVLREKNDSPLGKALEFAAITDIGRLVSLDDDYIRTLQFENAKGKIQALPRGLCDLIRILLAYRKHRHHSGIKYL